jgi:nucleotide-binding universal stress UspA family protein
MFQPRLILLPTDFSEHSTYAFNMAFDLPCQHQAKLLVLYVAETLGPENVTYGEAVSQREPDGYRQRLKAYVDHLIPQLPCAIQVEHLLAEGDPVREIDRVAREQHSDLIVMSTHGYSGFKRLFMGSVAEAVVRSAPCPVLVVKQPSKAT